MSTTQLRTVGNILDDMDAESAAKRLTGLALLRAPFPPNQISKLPKPTKAQTDAVKADYKAGIRCEVCGTWHHPKVVHLDYVGHAAATDRLLDADPRWTWDPVPDPASLGLPVAPGGMWIKLTVDGVSRYGFGCADGKSGGDAVKEIIGDAIRNAGMRFGMALDLWHKGDLHADDGESDSPPAVAERAAAPATIAASQCAELRKLIGQSGASEEAFCDYLKVGTLPELPATRFAAAKKALSDRINRDKPKSSPQASDILADDIPY